MKKLLTLALSLALTAAVGVASANTKLVVGASATPHAEILEAAKPILAEKGIDLEIVVFDDYVQPNLQLEAGDLDANYFQHIPYLEDFNAAQRHASGQRGRGALRADGSVREPGEGDHPRFHPGRRDHRHPERHRPTKPARWVCWNSTACSRWTRPPRIRRRPC